MLLLESKGKLAARVVADGTKFCISASGALDEDADLGPPLDMLVANKATYKHVELDLSGIEKLNSTGTRQWLLFIERLQSLSPYSFMGISEPFIQQCNVVPDMLGKRCESISLLEMPYFCATCDHEVRLFETVLALRAADGTLHAPERNCSKCEAKLEFDAIETEYFAFMKRVPK